MVPVRPEGEPATPRQVPEPEFLPETPAGRRSSTPVSTAPGGQPDPTPPAHLSPAAAAQALCARFLANADRGHHAANDELVTELVRRIRSRQAAALENQNLGWTDIPRRRVTVLERLGFLLARRPGGGACVLLAHRAGR